MISKRKSVGSFLLLLCPVFFLGSCRSLHHRLDSELEGESLDAMGLLLGSGWDSRSPSLPHSCIRDDVFEYGGAHSSDFTVLKDQSSDQLTNVIGGGLYAKASLLGLASAKVQGDVATSLATTDDTASLIYFLDITGKQVEIKRPEFNEIGKSAFDRNDFVHFREQCGNRFVKFARLGAQLFIGVKYTFTSKEQMEQVRLKISASLFWGLIKFSKTWSKEWRDMLANVRVSVEAFQIGGNADELRKVKDSVYQGSCEGNNAERCSEAVDKLLAYGNGPFREQLDGLRYSRDPRRGPAILDAETVEYRSTKVFHPGKGQDVTVDLPPDDGSSEDARLALNQLEDILRTIKTLLERAKLLGDFKLNEQEKGNIEIARRDLEEMEKRLNGTINGICRRALTDANLLAQCSAELGIVRGKVEQSAQN